MKLSIVTTLYCSEAYIEEFHRRATSTAESLVGDDYEIIYVNDGSPDGSLNTAISLSESDLHVIVVDLSRNFGHHKAMMTGLAHSRGDKVFLIDSDLEENPEWLLGFSRQMEEDGCDVVYGVQKQRKGGWFERLSGLWFYIIFRWLTRLDLPSNIIVARLMSRRYVNALIKHEEREVFMAGLWLITGFDQHPQTVSKRQSSQTTYTFRKKISMLVNSVTSFSNVPLVGIFLLGCFVLFFSIVYTVYLLIHWLLLATPPSGWTTLITSIWLLGGLTIACIGIIGIYLSKIFLETKRRPYAIVRQIYSQQIKD
jgi:putative glycosyltransferase